MNSQWEWLKNHYSCILNTDKINQDSYIAIIVDWKILAVCHLKGIGNKKVNKSMNKMSPPPLYGCYCHELYYSNKKGGKCT